MGDSENKEVLQNEAVAENKQADNAVDTKKADKPVKDKSATDKSVRKKGGFFRSLKSEFKKIVWPDKETTIKETTAVVIVTVILGAIIALLDFVIKTGLDKIIQMGSGDRLWQIQKRVGMWLILIQGMRIK